MVRINIVLQGESGGANLCRQARRQPRGNRRNLCHGSANLRRLRLERVRSARRTASLVENNSWFLNTTMMDVLVCGYDPDDAHRRDPPAWPYFATVDDLAGLPPHVISVNELDPLRRHGPTRTLTGVS